MDRIRKTKIVCTIGPSSGSVFELKRLVAAGMDVARFNCSHGDHEQYLGFIRNIRTASKDVALMFDTQGPEIRTGMLKTEVVLRNGQEFILTTDYCIGDSKKVQISYEKFPKEKFLNYQ